MSGVFCFHGQGAGTAASILDFAKRNCVLRIVDVF